MKSVGITAGRWVRRPKAESRRGSSTRRIIDAELMMLSLLQALLGYRDEARGIR